MHYTGTRTKLFASSLGRHMRNSVPINSVKWSGVEAPHKSATCSTSTKLFPNPTSTVGRGWSGVDESGGAVLIREAINLINLIDKIKLLIITDKINVPVDKIHKCLTKTRHVFVRCAQSCGRERIDAPSIRDW